MKISIHITKIEDCGGSVRVHGQGTAKRDAHWQPYRVVTFDAPVHIGRKYRIGQRIEIKVSK